MSDYTDKEQELLATKCLICNGSGVLKSCDDEHTCPDCVSGIKLERFEKFWIEEQRKNSFIWIHTMDGRKDHVKEIFKAGEGDE